MSTVCLYRFYPVSRKCPSSAHQEHKHSHERSIPPLPVVRCRGRADVVHFHSSDLRHPTQNCAIRIAPRFVPTIARPPRIPHHKPRNLLTVSLSRPYALPAPRKGRLPKQTRP